MTTIEDLLQEITERGWRVYQACQSETTTSWRVYLRLAANDPQVAYGEGPTLYDALTNAMEQREFEIVEEPTAAIADHEVYELSISDLRTMLYGPPKPSNLRGRI